MNTMHGAANPYQLGASETDQRPASLVIPKVTKWSRILQRSFLLTFFSISSNILV